MAFPAHWRLRISGVFQTSSGSNEQLEQWTNSINFDQEGARPDIEAWIVSHAVPACETLYAQSYLSASVRLTSIKMNEIGGDGKYVDPGVTHEVTDDSFNIAGQSSTRVEPQRALAVSWTTARRRGPAHRGRIYLPGYVTNVDNSLTVPTSGRQALSDNASLFLETLSGGGNFIPAVVSKSGSGHLNVITGVEVGGAVDTIRRRRNRLVEVYVQSDVDTAAARAARAPLR